MSPAAVKPDRDGEMTGGCDTIRRIQCMTSLADSRLPDEEARDSGEVNPFGRSGLVVSAAAIHGGAEHVSALARNAALAARGGGLDQAHLGGPAALQGWVP
jgi:hypothetical protein